MTNEKTHAKMNLFMRMLAFLLRLMRKKESKILTDYKEEMLVRLGRQQFKKLSDLGLGIPIRLA